MYISGLNRTHKKNKNIIQYTLKYKIIIFWY